jgi:hypothetical protein
MSSKQSTNTAIKRRMRDPKFTSLAALAASYNSRRCSGVLLQDADELIKRKRRCWVPNESAKITSVSVDAGFPPQTAKRWPGFRHKPRNQKSLRRNSPETEVR